MLGGRPPRGARLPGRQQRDAIRCGRASGWTASASHRVLPEANRGIRTPRSFPPRFQGEALFRSRSAPRHRRRSLRDCESLQWKEEIRMGLNYIPGQRHQPVAAARSGRASRRGIANANFGRRLDDLGAARAPGVPGGSVRRSPADVVDLGNEAVSRAGARCLGDPPPTWPSLRRRAGDARMEALSGDAVAYVGETGRHFILDTRRPPQRAPRSDRDDSGLR